MLKVAALVPMRHDSERVKGKNYRDFAGRPLFHHITKALSNCSLVSEIIIDTDSKTIADDLKKNFPLVRILNRPDHLIDGDIPMNDIILHDLSETDSVFYLQTHSTNPLLRTDTINSAIEKFFNTYPDCDSLFSVTKYQKRLWRESAIPVNHEPSILLRTQDLEPLYEENSCIYIFSRESMLENKTRIGKNPIMFETSKLESFDIDEEVDFIIAESIYKSINPQEYIGI